MTKVESKPFDCIRFKRAAQEQLYEKTKDMNLDQEAAYYRKIAINGSLGKWYQSIKTKNSKNRDEIAKAAEEARAQSKRGELTPMSAEKVIEHLNQLDKD